MKITILAGGTGSVQLQRGIYELFSGIPDLDITVLVNAYDNGLSTGAVRKVANGNILGPSDVRKNQTLIHELKHGKTQLLDLFNIRFSRPAHDVKQYVLDEIEKIRLNETKRSILKLAVDAYFDSPNALQIDYDDFSMSNILYAGLAMINHNSLRSAATVMASILDIPDTVIVNDDRSLFLKATTVSGQIISDEGDIVSWNNKDDRIQSIFFENPEGNIDEPVLCMEAWNAISYADIIISSSGTQWSSLIPTYVSKGFAEAYENSMSKKYLVMNKSEDKDMIGVSADEVLETVNSFMSLSKTAVIVDYSASASKILSDVTKSHEDRLIGDVVYGDFTAEFERIGSGRHHPVRLATAVFTNFFGEDSVLAQEYAFDYDDTLVGRGSSYAESSAKNRELLAKLVAAGKKVSVVTGNSIKAISLRTENSFVRKDLFDNGLSSIDVYADGGVNLYSFDLIKKFDPSTGTTPYAFSKCLATEFQLAQSDVKEILAVIKSTGIPSVKVENRHNITMSIKPIDAEYRQAITQLLSIKLPSYSVVATGRTTIDITKHGANKICAAKFIAAESPNRIVYVGDEVILGNDRPFVDFMAENNRLISAINVYNPNDTAMFLSLCVNSIKKEF